MKRSTKANETKADDLAGLQFSIEGDPYGPLR
jgi:hypothetical protein